MSLSPLCDRSITVTDMDYTPNRSGPVELVVLHDMEAPDRQGVAWNIGAYFNRGTGSSAHYGVDSWETVGYLDERHVAWAAPGANHNGVNIEQTGYASWTRDQWLQAGAMIRRSALLTADICKRSSLPVRLLTDDELANGAKGICHHLQVSRVFKRSDHWDTGYAFPFDVFMSHATGAAIKPDPLPFPEDDVVQAYLDTNNTIWYHSGLFAMPVTSFEMYQQHVAWGIVKPYGPQRIHPWTLDMFARVDSLPKSA